MARLLIHESTGIREFELVDDEVLIGRELDNALRISDPSVSRHHAVLRRTPQGYVIQDKQSANGVVVKGKKVNEAEISDGDQFLLGQIQLTFQDADSLSIDPTGDTTAPLDGAETNAASDQNTDVTGASLSESLKKTSELPGRQSLNGPATTKGDGYMSQGDNSKNIGKPGASPLLALLISIFVYNTGHIYNGQTAKWSVTTLVIVIGAILCVLPGMFIWVLSIIDAYQTAERLNSGELIPENEYSFALLYNIVKIIDNTATCSRA